MPETVNGQPDMWRSYMVLLGMLLFLSFQQGALSPVTWLLLSEIFPTRLRGIFYGRRGIRHVDRQFPYFAYVSGTAGKRRSGGRFLYLCAGRHCRRDICH
ncbi:hypothetical protein OJE16_13500 [Pantoea tagorei]